MELHCTLVKLLKLKNVCTDTVLVSLQWTFARHKCARPNLYRLWHNEIFQHSHPYNWFHFLFLKKKQQSQHSHTVSIVIQILLKVSFAHAYSESLYIHFSWSPACWLFRDNSCLDLACANGASQKFACAIFKDCAPCYHRSQILAVNTPVLDFWWPLAQLKIKNNRVSRL